MEKLEKKIKELVESSEIKFWNGHQIKRVSFGSWDMKSFQVNKKKYKFGVEISEKCNNQTQFIPTGYEFNLIDYKEGKVYSKIENISEFLQLPVETLQDLLLPMIIKSKFTKEEIDKSIADYRDFVMNFRKEFAGIKDNKETINYIKTTEITNLI